RSTIDKELRAALGAIVVEDVTGTNPVRNCTVTGKLLGLLVSGIPGIAISAPNGEIRSLVMRANGWHGVASRAEFESALKALGEQPRADNSDELAEFHMRAQARKLISLIRQA